MTKKHNHKNDKRNKFIVIIVCILVGFAILSFEYTSFQKSVSHVLSITDTNTLTPTESPPPWCYYANASCTVVCSNITPCPPCPTAYLVCLTPTPTVPVPSLPIVITPAVLLPIGPGCTYTYSVNLQNCVVQNGVNVCQGIPNNIVCPTNMELNQTHTIQTIPQSVSNPHNVGTSPTIMYITPHTVQTVSPTNQSERLQEQNNMFGKNQNPTPTKKINVLESLEKITWVPEFNFSDTYPTEPSTKKENSFLSLLIAINNAIKNSVNSFFSTIWLHTQIH